MATEKWKISGNSVLIYVIAFLLTTIFHELAHAVAGSIKGSDPVLHHNYVEHFSKEGLPIYDRVFITLAGPFVSLLQGLVAGAFYLKSQQKRTFDLFLLWFAVLGLNNALGYVMTGPVFKAGDIGEAYELINISFSFQVILTMIAAASLIFIAYKLTIPFLQFCHRKDWLSSGKERKGFLLLILILPWLIGSGIITVLYIPVIEIISIIYPVMSGMIFIFPWQNAETIVCVPASENQNITRTSFQLTIIFIVLIFVFKGVLARGIPFT